MTKGEWHITNHDMEFWADIGFFGDRDYLPDWWSIYASDISPALKAKRRWQASCRYRINGGLREEHRKLAAKLRFDVDCWRVDWASIYVDGKRPMGNSSREYDMAAALGWEIPENQDGEREMPPDMAELCWDLFDELPFAIHDMICTVVIDAT